MFNFLEDVNRKKEKEKKRKKLYGEALRLQIEQNEKRKIDEKIQSRQESLRNLKLFKNGEINNYNYKVLNNNKYENIFKKNKYMRTSVESPLNNNINDNFLEFNNQINSYNDKFNYLLNKNKEIMNKIKNTYQQIDLNLTEKKNNNLKSFFKNNTFNELKKINNFIETGKHVMKKSYSSFLNNNTLLKRNNYNNLFFPLENLNNFNNENNNIFNNNNALMEEINLQLLFREFVEQQIKIINEYEYNIEEIFFKYYKNNNNNYIKTLLDFEKKKAIQSIKNEQNKLKNNLGFFPMENSYNYKIEQLFNKILNKKITAYNSIKEMDNLITNNFIKKENEYIELLKYKSKYEDEKIENSIPNFQNLNINSQNTLRGYSKLVKINEKNIDNINKNEDNLNNFNFLESWREQLGKEITNDKKENFNYNENLDKNEKPNVLKENIKTFPANEFLKNVKNMDINKFLDANVENIDTNNLFLTEAKTINYGKRNKSSNDFKENNVNNKNYKKVSKSPINNNKINLNLNIENDNKISNISKNMNNNLFIKKKKNSYLKQNKGKNSFSFKRNEHSFMVNSKKGLKSSQSSNALRNYDNYLVLKRDDN